MRSLAQRSSAASKEIRGLIHESVDRVRCGVALVNAAGTSMAEIMHAISRVTDLMEEIAAASTEQGHGIDQVNQAVSEMDRATQHNAVRRGSGRRCAVAGRPEQAARRDDFDVHRPRRRRRAAATGSARCTPACRDRVREALRAGA
ncbi:methyl-accepting chemotaxis protein [Burkholderia lata]|uniref:methyl-accepting chemotaxis protein n=1 Tax=Burkholderia lata (strain ATCC 17760 / DSM 23089 / LMG 22485 / NCIMB 9086 / R18194 / 383) TaxID=482957 RepID=UPI003F68999C